MKENKDVQRCGKAVKGFLNKKDRFEINMGHDTEK